MVLATLATYHQLLIGTRRLRRLPDCKKPFSSEKNISQGWCSGFCQNQNDLLFLHISALVGINWKLELNRICISIVHKVHTPSGCSPIRKLSLFYHNWNFAPSAGEQSVGSEISFFGCPPPPDCTDGNHQHWQGPLPPPDTPETSPHHLTPYLPLQNIPLTPPPGTPASSTIFTNHQRRVPKNNYTVISSPNHRQQ